ncbi:electron transport complex subunit RsxA [Gammaproteobacteria bacterium]|nr:electron transport complex subunit RsxA [Pseudomonadales bacterium]MDB3909466.1 electron transport complex subunit RsxA [Gammaproteobacteria bacterium]MDC0413472.1 electron transport complex subunit RsxA [Gammaproteobacteria bacterium]
MTNYLSIIIAAALVNNLILIQLLGVSSLFYSTKRLPQAIEFALFNFVVLFAASITNLFFYRFVLIPLHIEFLRLVIFVGSSALLTTTLLRIISARLPITARQQGLLLFLTGGNSAVLGATLLSSNSILDFSENIAQNFGAALGYSLMIVGFAAVRLRLESADVPAPFRGSAIALITAGLVTISLLGFAGLT